MTHIFPVNSTIIHKNPGTTYWQVISHDTKGYELLPFYDNVPASETFICWFNVAHNHLKLKTAIRRH